MDEKYMTAREAAVILRMSSSTLAKLRVYGGGPNFLKLGGKVIYRQSDLDSWVATRVRASTSDNGVAA